MRLHLEQLNEMIVELLDVSQLRGGNLMFNETTYDLGEVVKKAINAIKPTLGSSHRILVNKTTTAEIKGDPLRIGQVVTNLISNAVKYSPEGGIIKVTIEDQGDSVRVSIKDNGIGIPKEKQKDIFERFYRVSEAARNSSGWGIGLYIAKEFVERQGGRIGLKSRPGKGSTFYFSLPKKKK